jgi:hypothetical protein
MQKLGIEDFKLSSRQRVSLDVAHSRVLRQEAFCGMVEQAVLSSFVLPLQKQVHQGPFGVPPDARSEIMFNQ